jgi:hypothetical protein
MTNFDTFRLPAAELAAERGVDLAYEADRAFDLMTAIKAAMDIYASHPLTKNKLHGVASGSQMTERDRWNTPYRRIFGHLESDYLAQHALFIDTQNAAGALIGRHTLGTEFLANENTNPAA